MDARFVFDGDLRAGESIELVGDELHHAARVMRVRPGEAVEVFNREAILFAAQVESVTRSGVRIRLDRQIPHRETRASVQLAMSLIQPERFELVLQKATELGVASFVPLITARVEVKASRVEERRERWERILLEAVKQSGRSRVPTIEKACSMDDLMSQARDTIVFDADVQESAAPPRPTNPRICIGPEGGWAGEEIERFQKAGASFQRLGVRRLRAETAAIAAVTLTMHDLGEL